MTGLLWVSLLEYSLTPSIPLCPFFLLCPLVSYLPVFFFHLIGHVYRLFASVFLLLHIYIYGYITPATNRPTFGGIGETHTFPLSVAALVAQAKADLGARDALWMVPLWDWRPSKPLSFASATRPSCSPTLGSTNAALTIGFSSGRRLTSLLGLCCMVIPRNGMPRTTVRQSQDRDAKQAGNISNLFACISEMPTPIRQRVHSPSISPTLHLRTHSIPRSRLVYHSRDSDQVPPSTLPLASRNIEWGLHQKAYGRR